MKYTHTRSFVSIAMAALVLVSLCAVCASPLSVSAAPGRSTNVQAPALVGAPVAGAPAVCAQDIYSLSLFVRGSDGALYFRPSTDMGTTWSTSKSLGGYLTSDPAATSPGGGGFIGVFVRGGDGALWWKSTTDRGATWSSWANLGGQLLAGTGPGVSSYGSTVFSIFVTGTDHALYKKISWDSTGGWEKVGGYLTSSPAVTASTSGVIDVYVRGGDGALWQREYSSTAWGSWASLGGQIAPNTGPAVCSSGPGRLDVFVQGTNGALYHRGYNSAWSGWENLGGKLTSSPGSTSRSSGTIDVLVRGGDNLVWQKSYDNVGGGWKGWKSIGGI